MTTIHGGKDEAMARPDSKVRCNNCDKSMPGKSVFALKRLWHPKCFACSHCSTPIRGKFHQKDNEAVCSTCFTKIFLQRCASCQGTISGEYYQALNSVWHKSCFHCTGCGEAFDDKHFFVVDGAHYCLDCHWGKRLAKILLEFDDKQNFLQPSSENESLNTEKKVTQKKIEVEKSGSCDEAGVCPKCRTICSTANVECSGCTAEVRFSCGKCEAPCWLWWGKCNTCKEKLPMDKGQGMWNGKELSEPPSLPVPIYSPTGPCPKCLAPKQNGDNKVCQNCFASLERTCETCRVRILPWWHRCNSCGWPNKFL